MMLFAIKNFMLSGIIVYQQYFPTPLNTNAYLTALSINFESYFLKTIAFITL